MLQILRGLHVDINDLELYYLVEMLESRIPGKTNYYRLMEYYVKNNKAKRSQTQNSQRPLLTTDSKRGISHSETKNILYLICIFILISREGDGCAIQCLARILPATCLLVPNTQIL